MMFRCENCALGACDPGLARAGIVASGSRAQLRVASNGRGGLVETRFMPNISIRLRLILLVSPAAGDPRRLVCASDPRVGRETREASPRKPALVSVVKKRQFGQQALRRFEVLGDRLRRHAARSLSASGGGRQGGARFRSEGDFRGRSAVVAAIRGEVDTMTDLARRPASPTPATTAPPATPCWRGPRAISRLSMTELDKIVDQVEQQALARRDASTRQAELAVKLAISRRTRRAGARIGLHCADRALDHRSS